jgi:hypothetical protein
VRHSAIGQQRTLKGAQKRATKLKAYRLLHMGQVIGIGGQATAFDVQHNSLSKAEETIVSDKINARFPESVDNLKALDRKPLQSDELLTLISMTAQHGYTVKNARDMKPPYGVILFELT